MLKVIAEDFIKKEAIETVIPLYRELVEATKQEPLCISYDLYVDQKDPGHFIFIEEWPNQEALDTHCASEHFKRLVPLINGYKKSDPIIKLMNSAFAPDK
ncbi:putative quinol monooxygenase [Providencia rettgeri]|uniref:putative quinol monooxygenase n=1 Tax=Providencia rettgeri TaxID=587 RepID=UPI0034E0902B